MATIVCMRCEKSVESRSRYTKYCPDCRRIVKNLACEAARKRRNKAKQAEQEQLPLTLQIPVISLKRQR